MIKVNHNCARGTITMVPQMCKVIKITDETPDIKTFRIQTVDGKRPFYPMPGQLGMWSIPGVGEGMFSVNACGDDWIESSVKRVGELTDAMHELSIGDHVGVRGPYGNGFPVDELKGSNVLFIMGGIAAAPVSSVVRWCIDHRGDYGRLDIVYGARTRADMPYKDEFFNKWPQVEDTFVHLTSYYKTDDWDGFVGSVNELVDAIGVSSENCKVVLCGTPNMIKRSTKVLVKNGFDRNDVVTSMEARMKCGIGKCGRCNIGSKYICLDGPVFTLTELDALPQD